MNYALVILLMLLKLGLGAHVDEVKEILEVLRQGDEQLRSTAQKDIVFVLGPTGAGKSTLVHLLAGNSKFLRSIPSDEYSDDDFIIEHLYSDKISNVTFESKTIYPDLLVDQNNVPYYDCPGFSDTRTTGIEISTTYFTRKVIGNAKRLKLVFVVNFHSMMKGSSSRSDFAEFVQHATEFLRNVKFYEKAIILVASKVPTHTGGDDKLVNKVKNFLKDYRKFLINDVSTDGLNSSGDVSNKIDLIDTFLINERIVLFKRPSAPGLLSELPDVMENRGKLQSSLNEKIDFVEMNGDDFGYTLSDRSKLKINALAEEINHKVTNLFVQIDQRVIGHYSTQQYANLESIVIIQNELNNVIKLLSQPKILSLASVFSSAKRLNISDLLLDFDRYMDYMNFLETIQGTLIQRRTSDWIGAIRSSAEHLAKEKNWFTFADKLWHRLSEYDVHRNVSKYDVVNVERWGLGDDKNGIWITEENFRSFLEKVMALGLLGDVVEVSSSKIDLLNSILNATVKSRNKCTCHSDKMTIEGNFIKFSELKSFKHSCGHSVKLIEVFGLSTVFFDVDYNISVDLVVIAPKWSVVHSHVQITLDGASGRDGAVGRDGEPGENGNHFFGYGDQLVNGESLHITSIGGNGGHGGNGDDGIDGYNVASPTDGNDGEPSYTKMVKHTETSDAGFLWFNRKNWKYDIFQSNAHCPSPNGLGGSGGLGGYGGTIEINGLLGIKTSTADGKKGAHGLVGKCGIAYDKVELFRTKSTSCFMWIFCGTKISWTEQRFNDETCLQNCRHSTSLVNPIGMSKPKINQRPDFPSSINRFKSFLRQNLQRMPMNATLLPHFIRSIERNANIRSMYDSGSFIDDFYQIENLFHGRSYNDVDLVVDIYQSLLERIDDYASNHSDDISAVDRKILANLYTAGLSQTCKVHSGTEQSLIVDIETYLDVAIDRISLLEQHGKRVVLDEFRNDYRRYLESKINENHDIITMDIRPAIQHLSARIDAAVETLLVKVLDQRNSVTAESDHYDRMKRELNDLMVPRGILKFVKIVADVAFAFTGFANVVGETLSTMNQVAVGFTNHNHEPSKKISHTPTTDEAKNNLLQLKSLTKQTPKSSSLLTIVDDILEMTTGFAFRDIFEQVNAIRKKLIGRKRVDLTSEEIDLLENHLRNIIDEKTDRNDKRPLQALHKIQKKLSMLRMDVDLFNRFTSNDDQLDAVESAVRESAKKLSELNDMERVLRHSIMPMVQYTQTVLTNFTRTVNDDKLPSVTTFKWRFQDILNEVRYQLQQFGRPEWRMSVELLHLFDKMDGLISALWNIFNRLEIYEDQVRLGDYIANIESSSNHMTNTSSQQALNLNRLNVLIESNVLLTIYGNALNGFKQTVFPFADFYLHRFKLPSQLEMETNVKSLVQKATDELVNLKLSLKEYHTASINSNDNLIHTADFSSDFTSSNPFYVWPGDEHRELIANLLSGKNVTVKVDITKGPKLNAVKFQYLQIHLKSSNQTDQTELDKFLRNFDVTIIHHGNSYYRCDDKFYLISSPTQRIMYSFETDVNGLPIRSNNVYQKMRKGNFILSPYALLTISLMARQPEQFTILRSDYGEHIDLELTGRGQYLHGNGNACFGIQNYYAADEVLVNEF